MSFCYIPTIEQYETIKNNECSQEILSMVKQKQVSVKCLWL